MTKITLAAFLLLSITSIAQKGNEFPNPFQYTLIDTTVTGSKSELYTKARAWFAQHYNSAKDVIQMDDKEAGKIIGRAVLIVPVKNGYGIRIGDSYVYYTITIDVRDNKYRCVLSNYIHEKGSTDMTGSGGALENEKPACGWFFMTKGLWTKYKEMAVEKSEGLIASLKNAMNGQTAKDDF